ncbi:hypothetical protein ACFXD5_05820 [Streptomyces sp. NPDC059385]|uniref:hypothetical protein n=1 Tax=Streptomyces sp. NPDC059385 TaxID=3346817 RepID=UPI00369169DF
MTTDLSLLTTAAGTWDFGKGDDETLDGFNAGAQGYTEVYEAPNAEEIATRRNPDAATAFFDAKGNGPDGDKATNDHLHYLAGSGDGTRDWPRNTDQADPTGHAGLGLPLEAATPGTRPSAPTGTPGP